MEEKNIRAKDGSCPSCGATMKYLAEKQKLHCESCGTCKEIVFEQITQKQDWASRAKATKSTRDWAKENKNLKCKNCGASVIISGLEYAKACPYCMSSLIGESAVLNNIVPDGIIPFKFSIDQASNMFVKGVKKKFFVPKKLKRAFPVEKVRGIYIPCFSYDAKSISDYRGTLAEDESYTDRKGRRSTRTTYKHISGKMNYENKNVLVESSSKLNQAQLSEILPYNMDQTVKFQQGFIMGYTVEQYESTVDECQVIAKRIMEENIKSAILHKYTYDRVVEFNMTTFYSDEKYMYYLLPTYRCAFKYKNKDYTTFMNGQTGKVGGGLPISPLKVTLFVLFILACILAIILPIAIFC